MYKRHDATDDWVRDRRALRTGRNAKGFRLTLTAPFIGREKECTVSKNGASNGPAENISLEWRDLSASLSLRYVAGRVKEVAGIKHVISQELVHSAVSRSCLNALPY